MDDSVAVRCDQSVGELSTSTEDLIRREAGPRQRFASCTAFNVFINNKAPLTLLNKVIYSGNARMAQSGGCASFGCKATAQFGVATSIGRQHLEGNYTMQMGVIRAQNHSHTAAANFLLDPVPADYEFTQHGSREYAFYSQARR